MYLDLRKIKRSGVDTEEIDFLYQPKNELCDIPQAKVEGPIKVNGTATLTGDHSVYLELNMEFNISGECMRCLEPVKQTFTAEFNDDLDDSDDTESGYQVVNDLVVLDKIIEDAVIMEIPKTLLCKDDCKGICLGCKVNLNNGECKCKK